MAMNDAYLNAIAGHGASIVSHVSLANGPAQGNELAVTRQSITWNAPVSGNNDSSNQPVFTVGEGLTVSHVQYWSAVTGGTFYGASPVTPETFASEGTYTITDADINHNAV